MTDGLIFEEGVQLAIKTLRQTPHTKLKITPFIQLEKDINQLHFSSAIRTAGVHHQLLGGRDGRLPDTKGLTEESPFGKPGL